MAVLNTALGKELAHLRASFRRAIIGYVVFAVAVIIAFYAFSVRQSSQIRDDVNTVARLGCYAGRENVRKFNRFVEEIILTREASATAHAIAGELTQARLDRDAVRRYEMAKLHVATDAECDRKILPPIQPPRRKANT